MNLRAEPLVYSFVIILSSYAVLCEDIAGIVSESEPLETVVPHILARKIWISQLFKEAETLFQMYSTTNDDCKKHFDLYRLHLRNQSIWAIKMMESSEWPSVGLFSGRTIHLGDYDECLSISSYGINGKYCLAEIEYDYPHDPAHSENAVENPSQKASVWEAMTMYRSNPIRVDRQKIKFAVCVPSSCKPDDLNISLNSTLLPIFKNQKLDVSVHVHPTSCKTKLEGYGYSRGFYFACGLFVFIFLLVISSTWSDMLHHDVNKIYDTKECNHLSTIYRSFSVVKNFRTLVEINPTTELAGIHFLKVGSMIGVIYVHRFFHFVASPKSNAEAVEQTWKWPRIEITHMDIVDVFFMISGFLTYFCQLTTARKEGVAFPLINALNRWFRMVPVAGILMVYVMYILPYTSDGPLWDDNVSNEVNKCKENWWILLLAMNNLIKSDRMCLIVTWYISTDIQLTIVGGILLLILCKNKGLGMFAIVFMFVGSTVATFTVAYLNRFHGLFRIFIKNSALEDFENETEFAEFYVAPYTRVAPYLVGFIGAIVTKTLIERKYKFSAIQTWLLWILSLLLIEGSAHYGFLFYLFGRENNENHRLENALYAAVHHWLFVLGFAILICVNYTSGLKILERFFNWKGFVPLGRLTYSFYLVNMVVQFYHTYSQRQVTQSHMQMNLVWLVLGDIIWIYLIGFLLHIFIEAPITGISKLLRKELSKLFGKLSSINECRKETEVIQQNWKIEAIDKFYTKIPCLRSVS